METDSKYRVFYNKMRDCFYAEMNNEINKKQKMRMNAEKIWHGKDGAAVVQVGDNFYPCEIGMGYDGEISKYTIIKALKKIQTSYDTFIYAERNVRFDSLEEAMQYANSEIRDYYSGEFIFDEVKHITPEQI